MYQSLVRSLYAAGFLFFCGISCCAAETADAVALVIVYDSSGSMADSVTDAQGVKSAKSRVALNALQSLSDRLAAFLQNPTNTPARSVDVALITFDNGYTKTALQLQPFTNTLVLAARAFRPAGGTPLGRAVLQAWSVLEKSSYFHKHILVITDGKNTIGPEPEKVLADLKRNPRSSDVLPKVHFIAFDVSSAIFDNVKKHDVSVVEALNEKELLYQVDYILTRKILLEAEE